MFSPVKIFLHVFPTIQTWHIAVTATLLMIYVFISEMKQLLYYSVKIFFHSILSIFFREVQTIGKQNIPQYGPVIFVGNHANQFIDSVVMLSTCQRTISYLMAEKSYRRRIVGDIAWAMGAVPVKRAQDSANIGTGEISLEFLAMETSSDNEVECRISKLKVIGSGTKFLSEINEKDKVFIKGLSVQFKVVSIQDDTNMELDTSILPSELELPVEPKPFEIMKRIDQKRVYEAVLKKLASGGTIGIVSDVCERTDFIGNFLNAFGFLHTCSFLKEALMIAPTYSL